MIFFPLGSKILEIGGGANPMRNNNGDRITTNMDIIPNPNVEIVHDLAVVPWPFEENQWDGIVAKYVLEHISWKKIDMIVAEISRVIKPEGKLVAFLPNTIKQCERLVEEGANLGTSELLFGSQEFEKDAGSHKTAFSPDFAKELFNKHGFKLVKVHPHPQSKTDMVVEAHKIEEIFERAYFDDGTIGYKNYRDFATHYSTVRNIMKEKPESLIDIGGARGYVVKILEGEGVKAICLDISRHCYMTRATDSFILWDATKIPWKRKSEVLYPEDPKGEYLNKIPDKAYDMAFSINFFEHIPEEELDEVIKESMRVSKRGMHGIHMTDCPYEEVDQDIDITHHIERPKTWWENKFREINPDYNVKIFHPRDIEYDLPKEQPPISKIIGPEDVDSIKLNLGSFQDMFYYNWVNIDILDLNDFIKKQAYNYLQHDLTKGIPYRDNEVELIVSNHMIEHITRPEGFKLLKECYRVLKPEGVIRFSTPDTKLITKKYLDGEIMEYRYINTGVENANDEAEAYYNLLLAGHKTIYDEEALKKMFKETGFKNIERVSWDDSRNPKIKKETLTTHPSLSLIIEAEK